MARFRQMLLDLIRKLFPYKIIHIDDADLRHVRDKRGNYRVKDEVAVVAPFIAPDGTFGEWGDVLGVQLYDDNIWTGEQTFNAPSVFDGLVTLNAILTLNARLNADDMIIRLGDAAGARTFTLQDSTGATIFTVDSNGNVILGLNRRLNFHENLRSYMVADAVNTYQIYVDNVQLVQYSTAFLTLYRPILLGGGGYVSFYAGGAPGVPANRAIVCAKAVGGKAHMFAIDEDSNEHDLTPNPSFTGSWINNEGDTVTVVNGIITTVV